MLILFLDLFLYLIEVLKYVCIYNIFFDLKPRELYKNIFLIILGCIVMWGFVTTNIVNPFIPYILFIIYETMVIYYNLNIRVIFLGIWSVFVIGLLDGMTRVIAETLLLSMGISNVLLESSISSGTTLVFLFVLSTIMQKKSQGKIEKISIPYYIFFLIVTISNTLIIVFLKEYVFVQIEVKNKIIVYLTFFGTAVGMFIEIAMVMLLAVSRNDYKEKNELNQKFLEEQKNHYKYLEERERETKLFRHDIRNHMNCIMESWHEQKYDEVGKYIEDICGRMENFGNVITVHNGIVDAILNKYYSDSKKMNVSMSVCGHLPVDCDIEAFDLCTIFSNLLANAIEAAAKSKKKCVEVECGYKDNKIMISIKNDYNGVVKIKDGMYITSKENSDYHGYGLINVKRSVDKYSGYINIEAEERFIVNMSLRYHNNKNIEFMNIGEAT